MSNLITRNEVIFGSRLLSFVLLLDINKKNKMKMLL